MWESPLTNEGSYSFAGFEGNHIICLSRPGQPLPPPSFVKHHRVDATAVFVPDSMQEQQEPSDRRWPRKLQWPSQKYLHASWVHTCQQLLLQAAAGPHQIPGEVKVASFVPLSRSQPSIQ